MSILSAFTALETGVGLSGGATTDAGFNVFGTGGATFGAAPSGDLKTSHFDLAEVLGGGGLGGGGGAAVAAGGAALAFDTGGGTLGHCEGMLASRTLGRGGGSRGH
jgi:hypothetical protein